MRVLSAQEIAALTKVGSGGVTATRTRGGRESIRKVDFPSLPTCDHDFVPDITFVASPGGQEFPSKRCTLCQIRLLLKPDEIQEETVVDMGAWLG